MDKWQSDLITDLNACSCKADPPREKRFADA